MTANYHTPLATGAALNAAVLEAPHSQLDSAVTALANGGSAFTGLNVGSDDDEVTLTIAGGAVTRTQIRHAIDTEGSASTDALTDINGGIAGQLLIIHAVSASRVVTVTHNAAKIFLSSRQDVTLDTPLAVLALMCWDGTIWVQIDHDVALSLSTYNSFQYPTNLAVKPSFAARNSFEVKAAAATIAFTGVATPTASGTPSASNDTDSTYINLLSGASSGNITGYVSATFNLVRRQHNPKMTILIRTGAAADIANIRFWIGFTSLAPTNVDTFASVLSFAGFRYSTVAGDGGFVPVTCDGTTQNVGTTMTNGSIVASSRYLLTVSMNDAAGTATFSVNNGATSTLSANLPGASLDLGYAFYLITTAAVAKNFKFSRMVIEYD